MESAQLHPPVYVVDFQEVLSLPSLSNIRARSRTKSCLWGSDSSSSSSCAPPAILVLLPWASESPCLPEKGPHKDSGSPSSSYPPEGPGELFAERRPWVSSKSPEVN